MLIDVVSIVVMVGLCGMFWIPMFHKYKADQWRHEEWMQTHQHEENRRQHLRQTYFQEKGVGRNRAGDG